MKQGLGTQLRHLLELLDGAVAAAYEDAKLPYRPRYTAVVKALMARSPLTIGEIAAQAGITQPAATQTVALMVKEGLLSSEPSPTDARQRRVMLTPAARRLLPKLQACWAATASAADALDAELSVPLSRVLAEAIVALQSRPFGERIAQARADIAASHTSRGPHR